jgi:hypothetical protein
VNQKSLRCASIAGFLLGGTLRGGLARYSAGVKFIATPFMQ